MILIQNVLVKQISQFLNSILRCELKCLSDLRKVNDLIWFPYLINLNITNIMHKMELDTHNATSMVYNISNVQLWYYTLM
jgi:hypothetical protein